MKVLGGIAALMSAVALLFMIGTVDAGYTHTTTSTIATTSTSTSTSSTSTTSTSSTFARKVFVCKYVGTPGVDERLQGGGNPISVAWLPGRDPGAFFNDAQGRSFVVAFDTGQPEPECSPPSPGTTTTSTTTPPSSTTTTPPTSSTTTTSPGTTLPPSTTSTTSPATSTTTVPATTTSSSTLPTTTAPSTTSTTPTTSEVTTSTPASTSSLPATTAPPTSTTSSTTIPTASSSTSSVPTTSSTTTLPSSTTSSTSSTTSSTVADTLDIGAASVVCSRDVPFVNLTFGNQPEFNGLTGSITFLDVNGEFVEAHEVVYQAGTTISLLFPGASVDGAGNATDWPGWQLNADGFWVLDPSDAIWREGLTIVAEINPTATTTIEYPPETAACSSPEGPFGPPPGGAPPGTLPATQ